MVRCCLWLRTRTCGCVDKHSLASATQTLRRAHSKKSMDSRSMERAWCAYAYQRIAYAKTQSDAVVAASNPDGLAAHQDERKERKRIWRRHNPQRLRAMLRHINAIKGACDAYQPHAAKLHCCLPNPPRRRHARKRISSLTNICRRISCSSSKGFHQVSASASSRASLERACIR